MKPYLIVLLSAFAAAFSLFGSRYIPTHDGEYHIIRFWQFFTMLSSGTFFPRWAPDLNNGYGVPLFTFQYPFPNYVGSILHLLGLSFVDSVKWTLGIGYLIAVTMSFVWLRRIFGKPAAVIGAITGAFVPYWFVDLYIRGAVGEVWGIAWVMASMAAVAAGKKIWIALSVFFLVVSHNIMALLFVPMIGLYALVKNVALVPAVMLGIGMASYFWMPALYEQQFIQGLSPVNIFEHFPDVSQLLIPSWGSGFRGATGGGNEMSYQIGIVPLMLLISAGFLAVTGRGKQYKKETLYALIVCYGAVVCMLPVSQLLWRILPLAHFIQYPWRLLSVVLIMVPVIASQVAARYRFGWGIALCAVLFAYGYSRPVTYEPRTDSYYLSHESLAKGTSSLGNAFQTQWFTSGNSTMPHEAVLSSGLVRVRREAPTVFSLDISASGAGTLIMPVAYYPGWVLAISGDTRIGMPDAQGLLTFSMPEGKYRAAVSLQLTWWQIAAICISILSLSVAAVSFILRK